MENDLLFIRVSQKGVFPVCPGFCWDRVGEDELVDV